jgi:hypothetical protein
LTKKSNIFKNLDNFDLFSNFYKNSKSPILNKFQNFPKYARRQVVSRFVALYEIFKLQLNIKGSIVDCGVHEGMSLMTFAQLSAILEPYNYHRKIIGFDSFSGFPNLSKKDKKNKISKKNGFKPNYDSYDDLKKSIEVFDSNRFLSNKIKIEIVKGDAIQTIPLYLKKNKHLIISLLMIDFDIYEPCKVALDNFLSVMPKGSIIVFDELNNPHWPGETEALLEELNINKLEIQNYNFEPNISFFIL